MPSPSSTQVPQAPEVKPCASLDGAAGLSAANNVDRPTAKSQASMSVAISEGGSSGAAFGTTTNVEDQCFAPPSPSKHSPGPADSIDDAHMHEDPAVDGSAAPPAAAASVPPPQELGGASAGAAAMAPPAPPALLHSAPGMYAPLTAYAAAAPPTPLPFAAMLTAQPPQMRIESLIGSTGSVQAVGSAGGHGLIVSGSVGGVPFSGVVGAPTSGLPALSS